MDTNSDSGSGSDVDTYTCACANPHSPTAPAFGRADHFASLDWLLEEQAVDLALQDRCSLARPYLGGGGVEGAPPCERGRADGLTRYPRYEAHTNTGYDAGAYRYDLRALHQARVANWFRRDPAGAAARRVGEFFAGRDRGDESGGWWYGCLLSME